MTEPSTSVRQSADATRNSLKLAILFAVTGLVLFALGWTAVRIAFGIAGFFLVVSLVESVNLRVRRRGLPRRAAPPVVPLPGDFARYLLNGEPAFGTTVMLADRVVLLDLREDKQLEARKSAVLALISHSDALAQNFDAFKRAEASRNERYTDVILGLEIEWISFHEDDPSQGEVCFTDESGEDQWFCGLRGLTFEGLTMES